MSASGQVKFTGNADKLFATFPCGKGNLELVSRGDLKKTGASSAAKGHKQSAISLFYRRQCDLPSLVVKSHHQERHFAVESTLLELFRDYFIDEQVCYHLPFLVGAIYDTKENESPSKGRSSNPSSPKSNNLALFDTKEHINPSIIMPWAGNDLRTACSIGSFQTPMDVVSLFLQLVWTLQTVADRFEVINSDLHDANVLIQHAPFGGHFLHRFVLKSDRRGSMVVTLRTRLMVTFADWVNVDLCSLGQSPVQMPKRLAEVVGYRKKSSSSPNRDPDEKRRARSTAASATTETLGVLTVTQLLHKSWKHLCSSTGVREILSRCPKLEHNGRPMRMEDLLAVSGWAGANLWLQVNKILDGCSDGAEFCSLTQQWSDIEELSDFTVSFANFDQREYVQWVPASEIVSSDDFSPITERNMQPMPELLNGWGPPLRKQGRPRKMDLTVSTSEVPDLASSNESMASSRSAASSQTMATDSQGSTPSELVEPLSEDILPETPVRRKRGRPRKHPLPETPKIEIIPAIDPYAEKIDASQEESVAKKVKLEETEERRYEILPGTPTVRGPITNLALLHAKIDVVLDSAFVYVRPSNIPGAGLGLFASHHIAANVIISVFSGVLVDGTAKPAPGDPHWMHSHKHELPLDGDGPKSIDGVRYPLYGVGAASFANYTGKNTKKLPNALFHEFNGSVRLVSTKRIDTDEEIIVARPNHAVF